MTHAGHFLLYVRTGTTDIVIWSLVLMGLLIVALAVVVRLKKKLTQADEISSPSGFTLSDLRQLYKSGKMSTEEFEKAKAQIVAIARTPASGNPTASLPKPGPPSRGESV
jgi:hypothetical protein